MLVLSRKKNQRIMIGDGISVTVLQVSKSHVTLGIEAPDGVLVMREELLEKIKKEKGLTDAQTSDIELEPGKTKVPPKED